MAALERLTTRINIEMTGDTKRYLVSDFNIAIRRSRCCKRLICQFDRNLRTGICACIVDMFPVRFLNIERNPRTCRDCVRRSIIDQFCDNVPCRLISLHKNPTGELEAAEYRPGSKKRPGRNDSSGKGNKGMS